MPQYQAPNPYPDFAEASDALVSQPTPSLQASGFTLNQRPSAANVNWLFRQLGRAARFFSQGINAAVQGATQELDWRLIGGGNWSWAASTGVLAWSEAFSLAMPGLTGAANSCAAGSVTLTAGQVAYANCNAPFSTTGTLTSGSKTVSDLAFESGVVVGATVTGPGVPAGATVTAVSTSDSTITLSAAATSSSANTALVFATSGPLTVKAANTATFAPSSNTVVLARCVAVADMPNHVIVGLNAGVMLLRDGEQKRLLSTGYVSTFTALAGVDMPARTPIYISPGGFRDANRTAGFAFPLEAASTAARAAFAGITTSSVVSGSRVEIVGAGRVFYAAGNLLPGLTYYADPATPGNITATAPTAATQYVVPLGNALTANMLLVYSSALPAAQTPATFAYKSILDMGSYWSTNTGANFLPLRRLLFNETNAGLSAVPEARIMSHAGSVVAINIHANNSVNAATVLAVIKNGAQLVQQVVLPANTTDKSIPLTKGLYTFVAGDVLSARVMFGTDTGGGGVANVTGLNIALDATLTLEMTP